MLRTFLVSICLLFSHVSWSDMGSPSFRGFTEVDFYLEWVSGKIKIVPRQNFAAGPFPVGVGVWKLSRDTEVASLYGDPPRVISGFWSRGDIEVAYSAPGLFSLELSEFETEGSSLMMKASYSRNVDLFHEGERVGRVDLGSFACFPHFRTSFCSVGNASLASPLRVPLGGEWLVFGGMNSSISISKNFSDVAEGVIDLTLTVL